MDALAGLLDGPRARGAFRIPTAWSGPWALRIARRIDPVADLLRHPDATVGAVADQVGCSAPFALGAAFEPAGVSPREHRASVGSTAS
jgi:hypothetical protein